MSKDEARKRIAQEISRLQELQRFLDDPTTGAILERYFSQNGDGNTSLPTARVNRNPSKRGALLLAVKKAAREHFPDSSEFTAAELIKQMMDSGYKFDAKNKVIAVNGALRRLVKKGAIAQTIEGSGRRGAKYKVPQRFSREAKGAVAVS